MVNDVALCIVVHCMIHDFSTSRGVFYSFGCDRLQFLALATHTLATHQQQHALKAILLHDGHVHNRRVPLSSSTQSSCQRFFAFLLDSCCTPPILRPTGGGGKSLALVTYRNTNYHTTARRFHAATEPEPATPFWTILQPQERAKTKCHSTAAGAASRAARVRAKLERRAEGCH